MRKIVKEKASFKTSIKIFSIIVCVLLGALLLVHIRVLTDNLKYENSSKGNIEKEFLKEKEILKRELESLKSPARIEQEARRFGMSYPQDWQLKEIKFIENDS